MAKENRDGRQARGAARAKVAAMQAAERRRERRTRLIAAIAALAALIGIVVLIQSRKDRVNPADARPAGVTETGGGIVTGAAAGSGKPVVEIYEDFQCPHCKDLEATISPTLKQLADSGAATVIYRPIAILGPASVRAGGAAGCAQDAGAFPALHDALYTNQAAALAGGFSESLLLDYARQAGVTSEAFSGCVKSRTYEPWARDATIKARERGVTGTPTVFVDGKRIELDPADPTAAAKLLAAVRPAG